MKEADRVIDPNKVLDPRVREAVLKAAIDSRIDCAAARELAERLGVAPGVIGDACNQLRIQIKACVLGCF